MLTTKWQHAAVAALHRYAIRHGTRLIKRRLLLQEELPTMITDVQSTGATPAYTFSRTLQELRRFGILHHVERRVDLLLDSPISVDAEDYPDKAIDVAIENEKLLICDVPTSDVLRTARFRKGQAKLREHTLENYNRMCGLCDIDKSELLVASHIVRWSDSVPLRGSLSNILCLCRMHDVLFEYGYIGLSEDYRVMSRKNVQSLVIQYLQTTAKELRQPKAYLPNRDCLNQHRIRVKLL